MTTPYASIAAELKRTLATRERTCPARVAKGTITMAESTRAIQMAATWLEDCHRYRTAEENYNAWSLRHADAIDAAQKQPTIPGILAAMNAIPCDFEGVQALAQDGRRFPAAALGAYPWPTRWRALQDELADRIRLYPGFVARGQLTQIDADTQIERLTAMLHRYDEMDDWHPSNGIRPCSPSSRNRTPEGLASFDEMTPYWFAIALRRGWFSREGLIASFPDYTHHLPPEQKEMFA